MGKEKDMSKDDKGFSIICRRCGRCCIEGSEGAVSLQDIARWIEQRRYDILEWISPS